MNENILNDFYDQDADRFWDPTDGMIGRDIHIYRLLEGLGGRVLDYGCGAGSLLLNLGLEDRFTDLIGVDISKIVLDRVATSWEQMAAPHQRDKLAVVQSLNDRIPSIPDHTVDLVLSLDTIEHVLDPFAVLDEFYRIAKPGATFVISVPNYGYIKHAVTLALGRQPITGGDEAIDSWRLTGWDGWHLHTFTRESLSILLNDCGWRPVLWTGYGTKYSRLGLDYLRRRFPAMWSGALTVVCQKKSSV